MARSKRFADRFPVRDSAALATLARNVKRLRDKRGWTEDDLAAAAKMEQMAVSLIESRRSNPTVETLENVATALRVPFVALFEPPQDDDPIPQPRKKTKAAKR
jgi:transcriptional regulator with XRE-family HTH domain